MSQLSKQLRALQLRPAGGATTESSLSTTASSGASFLFSKSDAKSYSREQILSLATDGLRSLLQIDNRFHPFLEILFHPDKTRQERALLTAEENQHIHQAVDAFLVLLSPHLFLSASHQALEYLIRVHEVHVYHPTSLLRAFLPYHDHNLFCRMLLLLDLRDTGFDFLEKNQERATPLLREDLMIACTQSRKVLQLVCECMILPVRLGVYHGAANALFAAVASRLASSTSNAVRPESLWRQLFPFVLECLTTAAPGLRLSTGMLATGSVGGEKVLEEQLALLDKEGEDGAVRRFGEHRQEDGTYKNSSSSERACRGTGAEISLPHREAVCTALLVVAAWSAEVQFSVPVLLTLLKPVLAYTREQATFTAGWNEKRRNGQPVDGEEAVERLHGDPTAVFFEEEEEERSPMQASSGRRTVVLFPFENWLLFLDLICRSQNAFREKHSQSAFSGVFRMLLQAPWREVVAMNPAYAQLHLRQRHAEEEEHFLSSFTSLMPIGGETGGVTRIGSALENDDMFSRPESTIPLAALLSSLIHFALERVRACQQLSSLSADVRQFLLMATSTLPLPLRLVQEILKITLRTHGKVVRLSPTDAEGGKENEEEGDEERSRQDREEEKEAMDFFQSILEALERRYPILFDTFLCAALRDPELGRVASFILSHHLKGTRYQLLQLPPTFSSSSSTASSSPLHGLLANEPLPFFACLIHPSPEVRRLGAEAADHQLSLTDLLSSSSSTLGSATPSPHRGRGGQHSLLEMLAHTMSYETDPMVASAFLKSCARPLRALVTSLFHPSSSGKDARRGDTEAEEEAAHVPFLPVPVMWEMIRTIIRAARQVTMLHSGHTSPPPVSHTETPKRPTDAIHPPQTEDACLTVAHACWEHILQPLFQQTLPHDDDGLSHSSATQEEADTEAALAREALHAEVLYAMVLLYTIAKGRESACLHSPTTPFVSIAIVTALKACIPALSVPTCSTTTTPSATSSSASLAGYSLQKDFPALDIFLSCPTLLVALYAPASQRLPELLRLAARVLKQPPPPPPSSSSLPPQENAKEIVEGPHESEDEEEGRRRALLSPSGATSPHSSSLPSTKQNGRSDTPVVPPRSSPVSGVLDAVYMECVLAVTCCVLVEMPSAPVPLSATRAARPHRGRASRLLHYFLLGTTLGERIIDDVHASAHPGAMPLKQRRRREAAQRQNRAKDAMAGGEDLFSSSSSSPTSAAPATEDGYLFALQQWQRDTLRVAQQQSLSLRGGGGGMGSDGDANRVGRGAHNNILAKTGYLPENTFTTLLGKAVYQGMTLALASPLSTIAEDVPTRTEKMEKETEDRAEGRGPSASDRASHDAAVLHLTVLLLPLLHAPLPSLSLAPHQLPYAYSRLLQLEIASDGSRAADAAASSALASLSGVSPGVSVLQKYFALSFFPLVRDAVYPPGEAMEGSTKKTEKGETKGVSSSSSVSTPASVPVWEACRTSGWWGALGLVLLLPLAVPEVHHAQRDVEVRRLQRTILHAASSTSRLPMTGETVPKKTKGSASRRASSAAREAGVVSLSFASSAEMILAYAMRGFSTSSAPTSVSLSSSRGCSMTALNAIVESFARASSCLSITSEAAEVVARCVVASWGAEADPDGRAASTLFMLPRGWAGKAIQHFFPLASSSSSSSRSLAPVPFPLHLLFPSLVPLLASASDTPVQHGEGEHRRRRPREGGPHVLRADVAYYIQTIAARSTVCSSPPASSAVSLETTMVPPPPPSVATLPVGVRLALLLLQYPVLHTTTTAFTPSSTAPQGETAAAASFAAPSVSTPTLRLYPYALSLLASVCQEGIPSSCREDGDGWRAQHQSATQESATPLIYRRTAATTPPNPKKKNSLLSSPISSSSTPVLSEEDMHTLLLAARPLLFSLMQRVGGGEKDVAQWCTHTIGGFHRVFLPLFASLCHRHAIEPSPARVHTPETKGQKRASVSRLPVDTMEDLDAMDELERWAIFAALLSGCVPSPETPQKGEVHEEKGRWVAPAGTAIDHPLTWEWADRVLALCAQVTPLADTAAAPHSSGKDHHHAVSSSTTAAPRTPPTPAGAASWRAARTEWALRVVVLVLQMAASIRPTRPSAWTDSESDQEEEAEKKDNASLGSPVVFSSVYHFIQEAFLPRFPLVSFLPLLIGAGASHAASSSSSSLLEHRTNRVVDDEEEEEAEAVVAISAKTPASLEGTTALSKAVQFLSLPTIEFSRFTRPVLHVWEMLIALSLHPLSPSDAPGRSRRRTTPPHRHSTALCEEDTREVGLRAQLVKEGLSMIIALLSPETIPEGEEEEGDTTEVPPEEETTVWSERRIALLTAMFHTFAPLLARSASIPSSPPSAVGAENNNAAEETRDIFAFHIPLVAIVIRLQRLDHTQTIGFQSAVDLCRRILTSFDGTTQLLSLSALMDLVMHPEDALTHFDHPLQKVDAQQRRMGNTTTSGSSGGNDVLTHADTPSRSIRAEMEAALMAKVFRKVVKPNQVINRQDVLLELLHATITSDAFLEKFIAIQFQHATTSHEGTPHTGSKSGGGPREVPHKKKNKKGKNDNKDTEEGEGEEEDREEEDGDAEGGVGACTALLTSSLALFSHYSSLNADTPLPRSRRVQRGEEEEEEDAAVQEALAAKGFVVWLERVAGSTLACVLAGIHENTFVQCLQTLLVDPRTAIQQKGLEVLLDRFHHSLPTVVDENAGGGAMENAEVEAYRKALRDPKQKVGVMDFIRVRARPRTTKRSFALLPLLEQIVTASLSGLHPPLGVPPPLSPASQDGTWGWEEKASTDDAHAAVTRLVLAVSCMEEVIRVVASGGSLQAEKTLLNAHRSKSVSVSTLVKLLGNKKRVEEVRHLVHATCQEWIPALQRECRHTWKALQSLLQERAETPATIEADARTRAEATPTTKKGKTKEMPHTSRKDNHRSTKAPQRHALQRRIQWCLHALAGLFTFLGTCGQVMGAGFMIPHCHEVLEVVVGSALDEVFGSHHFPPSTLPLSLSSSDTSSSSSSSWWAESGADKGESEGEEAAMHWREAHSLCRYATLTAFLRTFPSCWHMSEPFLPALLLVASHVRNVDDARTQPLCREMVAVLEAVLEPSVLLRAAAECLKGWDRSHLHVETPSSVPPLEVVDSLSSLPSSRPRGGSEKPAKAEVLRLSPSTHSISFFFQSGVHHLVERLNREEMLCLPFLSDGAQGRTNFWVSAFEMLASFTVLPPSDVVVVVLEAYYTFFIKFKAKHCNVYLNQLGVWAFGEAMTSPASITEGKTVGAQPADESRRAGASGERHASAAASPALSRTVLHRWTLFYSLYNFLLRKMGSIMDFSFGVVMPYVTQHLRRFSEKISTAGGWSAVTDGGDSDDETGRRESSRRSALLPHKALTSRVMAFLHELLEALRRMCTICTPGPNYDYSVPPEVYVAHPDVFKAVMPVLIHQICSQENYCSGALPQSEYNLSHSVVLTIRAFFSAIGCNTESGNKLQAKTQAEILRQLRHPHATIRRLTLKTLDGIYEDGGEELAARLMAEMLPPVVEMTEDRDELVVEEARTLCSHLSTITGQDVLHAMS